MRKFIIADRYLDHVCEAMGIEARRTSRVIIDAKAGNTVCVYVEMIGDEGLLEFIPTGVTKAEVKET